MTTVIPSPVAIDYPTVRRWHDGYRTSTGRKPLSVPNDDTGQLISALLLGLTNLRQRPPLAGEADIQERFDPLANLADEVAQKSHRLYSTLRSTNLDDSGLPLEIETLGLEDTLGHPLRLPREIETTIYRVAQEALTNILKYAAGRGATGASILLQRRGDMVRTVIEDDGPGFDVEATLSQPPGKRRLGIFGMEERARLGGGTLIIESEPGAGTSVYLHLPLTEQDLHNSF